MIEENIKRSKKEEEKKTQTKRTRTRKENKTEKKGTQPTEEKRTRKPYQRRNTNKIIKQIIIPILVLLISTPLHKYN